MRTPVVIGSSFVAQYPEGGGNFWVPLQYLLGVEELGHDACWLEYLWTRNDPARDRSCIDAFLGHARRLGVADRVALGYFATGTRDEPAGAPEYFGAIERVRAIGRDALLLNFAHSLPAGLREGFGRTVLFDVDPGPFQIWATEWDMGVGRHDVHLTLGQHLGAADSPIPLSGVHWERTWPAVHLASWPQQAPFGRREGAYTTVTQWWNSSWALLDGETYDCNKREGFLSLLSLPEKAAVVIELAANVHVNELEDRALLARHGWRLVDPSVVAGTPEAFRTYVQRSRGEVSAAKPAYVKARPGWVSDRTVCYLASGRPCIVEATGAEVHLPTSLGLHFFRTVEEAAAAIAVVEGDYVAASRDARALAEDVFATRVVLPKLLRAVGA